MGIKLVLIYSIDLSQNLPWEDIESMGGLINITCLDLLNIKEIEKTFPCTEKELK